MSLDVIKQTRPSPPFLHTVCSHKVDDWKACIGMMLDEATYGRLTFFSRNPCFSMRPSVISRLSWIWGRSAHTISIMECCAERVRPSLASRPILHFLFFSLHSYNTFSCFSTSVYYTGHKPNDKISGSEARGGLGARLGEIMKEFLWSTWDSNTIDYYRTTSYNVSTVHAYNGVHSGREEVVLWVWVTLRVKDIHHLPWWKHYLTEGRRICRR